jgi:hypothetical protein
MKECQACGVLIGNASKRCRFCGHGEGRPKDGYRRVYVPGHPMAGSDGYAREHRWLMYEMAIPVPDGHHVHHRNGIKDDNYLSNLEVIEEAEHHRLHVRAAGVISNQFGTFPVIHDPDEKRQHRNRQLRLSRAAKRARTVETGQLTTTTRRTGAS